MRYYLVNQRQKEGPYSWEQMPWDRVLTDTLIWHDGMPAWQLARDLPAFKGILQGKTATANAPCPASLEADPAKMPLSAKLESSPATDICSNVVPSERQAKPVPTSSHQQLAAIGFVVALLSIVALSFSDHPSEYRQQRVGPFQVLVPMNPSTPQSGGNSSRATNHSRSNDELFTNLQKKHPKLSTRPRTGPSASITAPVHIR